MRKAGLLLILLASLSLLAPAGVGAHADLKIVAPPRVEAPGDVPVVVRAGRDVERVVFFLDGRRRQVDEVPGWRGSLDTAALDSGRHLLVARALRSNGTTVRAKRSIRVLRREKTTGRRSKPRPTSPEPAPAPEPVPAPEPGPAPATEPEPAPEFEPTPAPEPAPGPAPPPSGNLLFRGDFDGGFTGWYVQSLSSRATLSSSAPFQGSHAARFEVRDGDVEPDTGSERSEVSGPTFDEGQDIFIRDAIRISATSTYQGPWQIVQQLHEESWSGSPGLAVFLSADDVLTLGAGDGSPTFWRSARLQRDRWYDLVYRVKLSRSSSAGFVEVWLDGVQQRLQNGGARAYGPTMQAAQTYLKAGIYRSRSSTGTSLVEHDAILVGDSLAAVNAG